MFIIIDNTHFFILILNKNIFAVWAGQLLSCIFQSRLFYLVLFSGYNYLFNSVITVPQGKAPQRHGIVVLSEYLSRVKLLLFFRRFHVKQTI